VSVGRLLTILISALLCACTADLVDAPTSAPSNPVPADNALNQATNPLLSWKANDADGAHTSYDVFLGTGTSLYAVGRGLRQPHCRPTYQLLRNTTYHWRVFTLNGSGIAKSDVWTFTTGIGSSPDVPSNPTPADGSDQAVHYIVLEWTGSDVDQDTLVYDVYFGSETNPPLAVAGLTTAHFVSDPLERGTYYWRVVARDRFGLMAESPTWSFHAVPIPGRVYNWAGTGSAQTGAMGQPPLATALYWPIDISFSPSGTPFVVDWNNHRIIATDASGNFKLVAGGVFGDPCLFSPPGCQNIVAAGSELNQPSHVAFDSNGNLVLSAWHSSQLFLIDMNTGLMDRICGAARSFSPDGEPAATTFINLATSAAFDSRGRLYYADQGNMVIRMIDESGIVHTVAGTNPVWDPNQSGWVAQFGYGGDGGPATSALLYFERGALALPSGKICFDADDNMYIADTFNQCIRKVDSSGIIHLLAGKPLGSPFADFLEPRDVAVDGNGNVFVADSRMNMILMVSPNGFVSRIAGQSGDDTVGEKDGVLADYAKFDGPMGIALDAHGNVWIADTRHSRIRVLYR
jgi:hypothetical protein